MVSTRRLQEVKVKRLIILIQIITIIILLYISPQAEEKYFEMVATGYCPCEICCSPWNNGLTYTGDVAGKGSIAIDPKARILKLGQKLYIEGYGYGVANDIGGAIKGWEIDLCFDTHQEALEWGRKLVKVYVLED